MRVLKINPALKDFLPPLTADEFQKLESLILVEGIRDPLVVWHDVIVDGHNRYEIAQKHNLDFQTVNMEFESETAAKLWMGENQLGKRNLTDGQRIEIALQMEPLFSEQARERQRGGQGGVLLPPISGEANRHDNETNRRIAKLAGVSHDRIKKYKELKETAPPEVLKEVLDGKKKINTAYRETRIGTAVCRECGAEKNLSEFASNGSGYCLACTTVLRRQRRAAKKQAPPPDCGESDAAYTIDDVATELGLVIDEFIKITNSCLREHRALILCADNKEKIIACLSEAEKATKEWRRSLS